MANLQDIRRRIRSVKNMQQITKSYKMVSAAKLRRAQDRLLAARPYANTMMRVLERLAARAGDYKHPLLERRGDERYVLALVTADRGLCGAFNTNLIKAAQRFIADNPGKQVDLVVVGRKGRDFFRRRSVPIVGEHVNVTARTFGYADAAEIARELMDMYTAEDSTVDKVFLLYSEFKSVLSQRAVVNQLLPIGAEDLAGSA
ncbi:MAG TPA: ATP synthase F1 subunit gamma, partial [Blastocatellia bacterium]|nr:ATP synthase F1 subunit gamma [Blastocatellia bacterium]